MRLSLRLVQVGCGFSYIEDEKGDEIATVYSSRTMDAAKLVTLWNFVGDFGLDGIVNLLSDKSKLEDENILLKNEIAELKDEKKELPI